MSVVPWVVSGKSVQALAGQAERLLAYVRLIRRLDRGGCGVSLAGAVGV